MPSAPQTSSDGGWTPALHDGQILAGRYRIEKLLGHGAVGEVYEAEDMELGERIAVKILGRGIAGEERTLRRFKQEIQLARRVTHPNVCRTYDLVVGGDASPLVFLTMELLRGETLAERLARDGWMSPAAALPVVRQVAAALGAAHAAGVVHRDLKSANIFLTHTFLEDQPSGEMRAVVNDFGLARVSAGTSAAATLTATGEMVGSPAYMAPEQVRGETVTPATDIYALGVVLYEMVTGDLPFVCDSAFSTALKRLREPPPSPRVKVPGLDPAWEAVILRCLAREPADRFAGMDDVVHALAGETPALPLRTRAIPRPRPVWIGAGACLLFLGAGALALLIPRAAPHPSPVSRPLRAASLSPPAPPARPSRPSIAVLGFENLSGDPRFAYLGAALFQMLPTELAASEELRLVPVENVDRARRDLGLAGRAGLAAGSLGRLRNRLNVDLVVSGSYLVTEGGRHTRIDVAVQDTRTGETTAVLSASGSEDAFLSTLASLGEGLRARLGAGRLSVREEETVRAALPATLGAARLYTEGLAELRLYEAPRARDLLLRAVAAEPENPLFHSALASAWWDLGYRERARREAKRAVELSQGLRLEDRRWIAARFAELGYDWETAILIYRELAGYFPDNLEYGLRLAALQTTVGRVDDAAGALAALHRLPAPLGDDPRIDLAAAFAAGVRAQYAAQRDAAGEAARKGAALGAPLLVAEAQIQEGLALQRLGDIAGAGERFERAEAHFREAGSLRGVAEALRTRGALLFDQSDLPGAQKLYEQAVDLYRRVGDEGGAADTTNEIGNLFLKAGDTARAERFLLQARAGMERVRDQRGLADVLHRLGVLHFGRNDTAGAEILFQQALALQRAGGFAAAEAKTLQGLARIASLRGDLRGALRYDDQAIAIQRASGDLRGLAIVLQNAAAVHFDLGDMAAARRGREEALRLSQQAGYQEEIARALRGLADVDRQEGKLASAQDRYEKAFALYRRLRQTPQQASMLHEIGRVYVLRHEPARALEIFGQALGLCGGPGRCPGEAAVLNDAGAARRLLGDLDGARAAHERALLLSRAAHDNAEQTRALAGLGRCKKGRPAKASL